MDAHLLNILLLGLAFMIVFTAFQATSMVEVSCLMPKCDSSRVPFLHATQQSVLEGVKNDTINGTDFQGSGYLR